jgi:transposase InsO family protein
MAHNPLRCIRLCTRLQLIEPDQLLIHTDLVSQYRATAYRKLLEERGISYSMSSKCCCWDNSVLESFFSILKGELDLNDEAPALQAA